MSTIAREAPRVPASTPGHMQRNVNLGRMKGRPVIDANGDNVGVVDDVVVDPSSWKVSGFVVNLKREVAQRFQLQAGFLDSPRVELGSERIKTVGDNVILNIELDVIRESLRRRETTYDDARPPEGAVPYDPVTSGSTAVPPPGTSPIEPPRS